MRYFGILKVLNKMFSGGKSKKGDKVKVSPKHSACSQFVFLLLSNSETIFGFSLALLFLVKVKYLGYNKDFNGKCTFDKNILKKALSDGPSANLRQLYNKNVAKVY